MKWKVDIDYPSEVMEVEAKTKEEAEEKALETLGDVTFNAEKECTAYAYIQE